MPELTGEALQAEVLRHMRETGEGYKRTARRFGLPTSTVADWGRADRNGQPLPKPDARTDHRAEERLEREARKQIERNTPRARDTRKKGLDHGECTQEEYLLAEIRDTLAEQKEASEAGHGGVARQWAEMRAKLRAELVALREAQRLEREAVARVAEPSPSDVARRILKQHRALVRVLDRAEAIRLCKSLCAALGGSFQEGIGVDEPEPGTEGGGE